MLLPKYWSLEMEDEPENLATLISLSWEEEGRRGVGEGGRDRKQWEEVIIHRKITTNITWPSYNHVATQ